MSEETKRPLSQRINDLLCAKNATGVSAMQIYAVVEPELTAERKLRVEAEDKLSRIFHWIGRNHPDGFIDSQPYDTQLDRVMDRMHGRIEAAEASRDEALKALRWIPLSEWRPNHFVTVFTRHEIDLYPTPAFWTGECWLRETEGPEDEPRIGRHEVLYRIPTHWLPIPPLTPTQPQENALLREIERTPYEL
jgi:hypothetical protein